MIISYDVFENLDETKKLAIINAGFKIFGEYGYAKSSVDAITKEAGISKGSLFYYFQSKKNFFIYLYEYSASKIENIIDNPGADGMPSYMIYTDFFERLNAIQYMKRKHFYDYPCMYDFAKKAIFDNSPAIKDDIKYINSKYINKRSMAFLQGLDYSKFKEGIDPMMVMQLLSWCSEGCANLVAAKYKQKSLDNHTSSFFKEVVDLYEAYVALFRNNFYKEEYL